MEQPVVPFDLLRMILGEEPPLFLLEIVVRTVIVYFYTLVLIRWIGGRGIAQMSLVEFLLVIALGSAVGDSLFYPDVPLIHALLCITLIVLFDKGLDKLIVRFRTAKRVIDGMPVQLIADGRILQAGICERDMGSAEVLALLRLEGIRNLGEVEFAYMEAGGRLSVFRKMAPGLGLTIVPPHEIQTVNRITAASQVVNACVCCVVCGALTDVTHALPDGVCTYCGHSDWTMPAIAK